MRPCRLPIRGSSGVPASSFRIQAVALGAVGDPLFLGKTGPQRRHRRRQAALHRILGGLPQLANVIVGDLDQSIDVGREFGSVTSEPFEQGGALAAILNDSKPGDQQQQWQQHGRDAEPIPAPQRERFRAAVTRADQATLLGSARDNAPALRTIGVAP